jgi:hypothetical protein
MRCARRRTIAAVAFLAAGCSGPSGSSTPGPTPVPVSSVASLSLTLAGAPSLTVAQSATTYPIVVHAFRSDGTLIAGDYAQEVIVLLSPPGCVTGLGLAGGSPPTETVPVIVSPGLCGPGIAGPHYSVTSTSSSSTALSLTWNGTPIGSPGTLTAYAKGVPQVSVPVP